MMAATVAFVTSCGEDVEDIIGGGDITLSSDKGTITDGRLIASPGSEVTITASLGASSTEDVSVVTNNSAVASVPATNTFASGGSIVITVGSTVGEEGTLTFSGSGNTEQLVIEVGYNTVVDAAIATPSLSTLVAAVQAADLVTTLSDETKTYTVFAPTNDAFAALATQLGVSATELLARDDLDDILLYHVVGSEEKEAALTDGKVLTTARADGLSVVVLVASNGDIRVNNANVTIADIETGNGVVHIIDRVLLPQTVANYEAVLFEAPVKNANSVAGSRTSKTFFSAADGETYSVEEVLVGTSITSAGIDFGYYYGATNNASLASPATYPKAVYDLTSTGANWNALNTTLFRPVNNFTLDDYNAITAADAARLVQEYEISSGEVGEITGLSAGDLFAFKTVDNRYGVLQVVKITATDGSDGRIELKVKVTK